MEELNPDSTFTVKESIVIDLLVAGFCYAMFFSGVAYNSDSGFFAITLLPAIAFTLRAFVRAAVITVSKEGIWFGKNQVTDWKNFIRANVEQLELMDGSNYGISDRVVLHVEFFKGTEGDVYKQTIRLTNSQNRSEEEIIAAIEYFHELYVKEV